MLALAGTCAGCAFIRNPPAESTPLRTARYLRTKDAANFALGSACQATLGIVIHGDDVKPVLARQLLCTTGAIVQRSVDKGYRESGGLFVISGSWVLQIGRLFVKLARQ